MIASGGGWPASGSGSGLSGTTRDRSGDTAGSRGAGVPPVTPTDPAGDRAWRRPPERPDAGAAGRSRDATAPSARHAGAGGRALVPVRAPEVSAARDGAVGPTAGLPLARTADPSARDAPALAHLVQVAAIWPGAAGQTGAGASTSRVAGGAGGSVAPHQAAAASHAYRQRGAWPPLGLGPGAILRVSI